MSQELGRISRPSAAQYEGRRKLILVPLVYGPPGDVPDGAVALQNYWEQMQTQVESLQAALGGLHHIYHESLSQGGDDGLQLLEQADQRSHKFVTAKCEAGAVLEATEDDEVLLETLDLQRCLMMALSSAKVATRLHEWYTESNKSRYEHIATQIDQTLGENQVGLLFIGERHQVQFPSDIEVFYVSPPALEEFRRWLQNWAAAQQRPSEGDSGPEDETVSAGPGGEIGEGSEEEQEERPE